MSVCVRRFADVAPEELRSLELRMADFYKFPPPEYYALADRATHRYTPDLQPFHCDLLQRISPGSTVLELGCGSAHFCREVENRGARYTGMDHSAALLTDNAHRFPRARFLAIDRDPGELFDTVASLYTLEHVAQPPS